jgi:hypothetical protein
MGLGFYSILMYFSLLKSIFNKNLMKTKLLNVLLCIFAISAANAQTISIVGPGVNGWPPTNGPEITLSTTDNENYTIENLVVTTGSVKFRQDLDWAINWGSLSFPNGTGTQNGPDIPATAGTYTVNFNRLTGAYSFVGAPLFDSIGILGTILGPNGFDGPDVDMTTSDGVTYTLSGFTYQDGLMKFRMNDAWTTNWGGGSFPGGTAVLDGADIPVPAGTYSLTFNKNTGAYSFSFVSIGFLGTVIPTGFDGPDVDLETTDGVTYSGAYALMDGLLKFRQDDSWTTNWGGGGIVPNVLVPNGQDIPVSPAGNYLITFNRSTLEYSIVPTLGVNADTANSFTVYPNPSRQDWNFSNTNTSIDSISIMDFTGKTVLAVSPNTQLAAVDASGLSAGIYFARIVSANATQTIKLIKE